MPLDIVTKRRKGSQMNIILILTFRKQSLTKSQPGTERLSQKEGRGVHDVGRALGRKALNGRASGV